MKKIGLKELRANLKKGEPQPVYQVLGPGTWTRRQAVALLRHAVVGEEESPWVVSQGRCGEVDMGTVLDGARTLPMGAARRFVLLSAAENLRPADVAPLADYVTSPSPTTCLVIQGEKLPSAGAGLKSLRGAGVVVECPALRPYEIPRWLESEIKSRGRQAGRGAADRLQELLGDDPEELIAGLEKVLLFLGDTKGPLSADTVAKVLSPVPHGDVWAFIEALEELNISRALAGLESLLDQGEPPEGILRLIARSRRQLLAGQTARRHGGSDDDVLEAMSVHPKARAVPRLRRAILGRVAKHNLEALAAAPRRLLQADSELKIRLLQDDWQSQEVGAGEPRVVLTRLLLDLLPSRRAGVSRRRA